jgi:hypothetical protein
MLPRGPRTLAGPDVPWFCLQGPLCNHRRYVGSAIQAPRAREDRFAQTRSDEWLLLATCIEECPGVPDQLDLLWERVAPLRDMIGP